MNKRSSSGGLLVCYTCAMRYSQKYTLVYFISPIRTGTEFHMTDWPLHTTLADVFAIDRHATDIDKKLAALATRTHAVQVAATDSSTLGTAPVALLEKSVSLLQLHDSIVSLLEENEATFNSPEFIKDGFLPHSTIQKSGRLQVGEVVTINSISLIDMFPNDDWQQRKVLATFKFN